MCYLYRRAPVTFFLKDLLTRVGLCMKIPGHLSSMLTKTKQNQTKTHAETNANNIDAYRCSTLHYIRTAFLQVTTIAGTIPSLMLIRYTGGSYAAYMLYAFAGGVLAAITGPNIKAVLM